MLDDRQRLLFARLSVFTGGWDLGAAEEVASGGVVVSSLILDLQESLIENSLVLADHTDHLRSRYRMLEAVRAYAAEALEALGGTVEVRDRLAAWALGVVEPRERPWIPEMSDAELSRLDREHANLLEALDHLGRQGRPEEIDLALALGPFWLLRVQWNTAHGRLRSALDRHPEGDAARVRACLLLDHVEGLLGDWRATRDNLDAALEIAVRLGDGPSLCDALHVKGGGLMSRGKYEAAASLLTEAVGRARALGDAARELDSVGLLALIASIVGHHHEARAQAERALALARLRSDPGREHRWLEQLGWIARDLGEPAEAERLFAQAAAVAADSTLGVDPPLDGR
jgi:non-specific serine/threonine protein kinase